MDSSNRRQRPAQRTRAQRAPAANNRRSRNRHNTNNRHNNRTAHNSRAHTAKVVYGNSLRLIDEYGPRFVIWILIAGVAAVVAGFLAAASARHGGFWYGLWSVLLALSKAICGLSIFLAATAYIRKLLRSRSEYNETGGLPDKSLFKKFHQLKYELLREDGEGDTTQSQSRQSQTSSNDDDDTDNLLDLLDD